VRKTGVLVPEAVAELAGVSPATLYTYFGSKDAVLAAALEAALDDFGADLETNLDIEKLLEDGLEVLARKLVRAIVKRYTHDARLLRLGVSRLPDSSLILGLYRGRREEHLAIIGRFIKLGQAAGKLDDRNPSPTSRALLVQLHGLTDPMVLIGASGPVIEEIGRQVHDLLAPKSPEARSEEATPAG
jgi:AcrR family transcriptional regulator